MIPATSQPVLIETEDRFETVVARLEQAFLNLGVTPVARFDHAAAAARAGLDLEPTLVFVFGDPRVGTLLMQRQSTIALDLPLKIMVFERQAKTSVAYHDPRELARWHGLADPGEPAERMARALQGLALAAGGPAARIQTSR